MNNDTFIPDDYDELLKQYKELKKELNETKQNLYETSRQLKVNDALLTEYQSDIELLQGREQTKNGKLEAKIANLEETISNLRSNHLESISYLETELEKKEKENEDLRIQMETLYKKNAVEATNDISATLNDITHLTNENELLQEKLQEMEEAFEHLKRQYSSLEEAVEHYKEDIVQLKESLNVKREELSENVILIDKLNDELMCANKELENYKHKPLEAESKGNSLFAEVDDRRVHLQKTINHMKSTYIRLRQEHGQQEKLISQLRKENVNLRESWKQDLEKMQEDKYWVNDTLKRHVKMLEEIIADQKKQLEEKSFISENVRPEYRYYQQTIDDKSNEIEKWKKKYSDTLINEHLLSTNLAEANRKVQILRLDLQQRAEEIREAKSQSETVKNEIFCAKCKTNEDDFRKTERIEMEGVHKSDASLNRNPMKSSMKQKGVIMPDNDSTLDFNSTLDCIKKQGDYNIFSTDITQRKKVQTFSTSTVGNDTEQIVDTTVYTDTKEELKSFEDKENIDNTDTKTNKETKGVTFTKDTVDPVGNVARRRGARIFIMNKKSDVNGTS